MEPNNEVAKNKTYKQCDCGADCYLHDVADAGICWGQVDAVEEVEDGDSHYWIHACKGHEDVPDGGKYKAMGDDKS